MRAASEISVFCSSIIWIRVFHLPIRMYYPAKEKGIDWVFHGNPTIPSHVLIALVPRFRVQLGLHRSSKKSCNHHSTYIYIHPRIKRQVKPLVGIIFTVHRKALYIYLFKSHLTYNTKHEGWRENCSNSNLPIYKSNPLNAVFRSYYFVALGKSMVN